MWPKTKGPADAARSTLATTGLPFASNDTETEPSTVVCHLAGEEELTWEGSDGFELIGLEIVGGLRKDPVYV